MEPFDIKKHRYVCTWMDEWYILYMDREIQFKAV